MPTAAPQYAQHDPTPPEQRSALPFEGGHDVGSATDPGGTSPNDGTAGCAICGHVAVDDLWCALTGGLVCSACCTRVRSLDPDAVIDALSHAEMALSPDEVSYACTACDAVTSAEGEFSNGSSLPS